LSKLVDPGHVTLSSAPANIPFQQNASGTSYLYSYTHAMNAVPDGTYSLSVTATDSVGNVGMTALALPAPGAVITTAIPAPPDTRPGGPVTYTRIPWGSNGTLGIPSFAVQGLSGAAQGPGTAIVYDGLDVGSNGTARELGRASIDGNGAFGSALDGNSIALGGADRPAVYVAVTDEAGNLSPPLAVHNITWVATFGGKVSGSTFNNPNAAKIVPAFTVRNGPDSSVLFGPLQQDAANSAEPADYTPLVAVDASVVSATNAESWSQVGQLSAPPVPVSQNLMAYDAARGVMVLVSLGAATTTTWEWDGRVWVDVTPQGRSPSGGVGGASLIYDSARGVTVLYTGSSDGSGRDSTWEWHGTEWTDMTPCPEELQPPGNPTPPSGGAMAYDSARGVTVLLGVSAGVSANSNTWEWNGSNWVDVTPAGPAPRSSTLVYDAAHAVAVSFADGSLANGQTWEWNGSSWKNVTASTPLTSASSTSESPSCGGEAMAYDTRRGVTILNGGAVGTHCEGAEHETWEWNGETWTDRTPPGGGPVGGTQNAIAYDSANGEMVFSDGVGELWTWDGALWRNISTSGAAPMAREGQSSVYDTARSVTLVFGGTGRDPATGASLLLNDTWEWDGIRWTNVTPPGGGSSPPAAGAMAYDESRSVAVLFGGDVTTQTSGCTVPDGSAGYLCGDTWEWNGVLWSDVTPSVGNPPAGLGQMAFDASLGGVVLYASDESTWLWNGSEWTNLAPSGSGPIAPGLWYDSANGVLVLGGNWKWSGSAWISEATWTSTNQCPVAGCTPGPLAFDTSRGMTLEYDEPGLTLTWEEGASTGLVNVTPAVSPSAVAYQALHTIPPAVRSSCLAAGTATETCSTRRGLIPRPTPTAAQRSSRVSPSGLQVACIRQSGASLSPPYQAHSAIPLRSLARALLTTRRRSHSGMAVPGPGVKVRLSGVAAPPPPALSPSHIPPRPQVRLNGTCLVRPARRR
jgi:hypothetical protein